MRPSSLLLDVDEKWGIARPQLERCMSRPPNTLHHFLVRFLPYVPFYLTYFLSGVLPSPSITSAYRTLVQIFLAQQLSPAAFRSRKKIRTRSTRLGCELCIGTTYERHLESYNRQMAVQHCRLASDAGTGADRRRSNGRSSLLNRWGGRWGARVCDSVRSRFRVFVYTRFRVFT